MRVNLNVNSLPAQPDGHDISLTFLGLEILLTPSEAKHIASELVKAAEKAPGEKIPA